MVEIVQEVDWAKDKLDSFPKAKKNLGPLLDALGRECHSRLELLSILTLYFLEPITQIIGAVGLLLAGVLNLLGNLLKGLGLDGLLKGLIGATVRTRPIYSRITLSHNFHRASTRFSRVLALTSGLEREVSFDLILV
jgi:hypothetical protein